MFRMLLFWQPIALAYAAATIARTGILNCQRTHAFSGAPLAAWRCAYCWRCHASIAATASVAVANW